MAMKPERWQQVDQLFQAALERAPEDRPAFLNEACGADDSLRREIEALLAADGQAGSLIETPAYAAVAPLIAGSDTQSLLGKSVGHYQILSLVGKGGMGEVYAAKDTRLGRKVALKLLPAEFTTDAERVRRFEREARAASALNHPNILTIYDIGEDGGQHFIAAELVEGVTVRQQLEGKRPTLAEALKIAIQIAAALEAAHGAGIVHRDIKPENVMVRPDGLVKVLDFGLAKLAPPPVPLNSSEAPALVRQSTEAGVVLGTLRYMSPEQARGEKVDVRTDIFSLGVMLYELVAGRTPFDGMTASETIAAILRDEPPDLSGANAKAGGQFERIVRRCLEKKPERRFQSASDLGFALETVGSHTGWSSGAQSSEVAGVVADPTGGKWHIGPGQAGWLAAAVFLVVSVGLSIAYFRRAQPETHALRFTQFAPEKTNLGVFSVSPDGQQLAFNATDSDRKTLLYIRPMNSFTAQALPGTEGAYLPFWSPDSRSLGFFSEGKLKRIELSGGAPQTLCESKVAGGGSWNQAGEIILGAGNVIHRVPATGGVPSAVTTLDPAHEEIAHRLPQFLPDGQHFLYSVGCRQASHNGIYVGSLSGKAPTLVRNTQFSGTYTAGHLLFARDGALLGQALDASALKLSGEPFLVAAQVKATGMSENLSFTHFSVSEGEVLAYQSAVSQTSQMIWHDRTGKRLGAVGEPADYSNPSLSPDDKRLAVDIRSPETKKRDLWLFDLARGLKSRFTFDPADDLDSVWSKDGSRIFFSSDRKGQRDIFQKRVDATEEEELIYRSPGMKNVNDLSPDGRLVIYNVNIVGVPHGLWLLQLEGERVAKPLLKTQFGEDHAAISPDGRWMAYRSNESGRFEIYVATFPQLIGRWQVSVSGGTEPRWRRGGKELFFVAGDRKLMAAEVKTGGGVFKAGVPRLLFETQFVTPILRNRYVVTGDGNRFLVIARVEDTTPTLINVVVNWMAEVKR
jgi:eukaryotic-like serine/threonine-protein kinase